MHKSGPQGPDPKLFSSGGGIVPDGILSAIQANFPPAWFPCLPHPIPRRGLIMARHTRSLVPIALLFCGFLTKAGAQSEAGLPKLDLPPSLLRIHPAAIATGSRVVLELTGAGMETAVDLLASRPGLVFRILPQDQLPAPAKAGARPMPRPAKTPSRLACRSRCSSAGPHTAGTQSSVGQSGYRCFR